MACLAAETILKILVPECHRKKSEAHKVMPQKSKEEMLQLYFSLKKIKPKFLDHYGTFILF